MVPTSAASLKRLPLLPPPLTKRPGRKRRRRMQRKMKDPIESDPVLPCFGPSKKKVIRYCSLCGCTGHYASTCREPSSIKVITDSQLYKSYLQKTERGR